MKKPIYLLVALATWACSVAYAQGCDKPRDLWGTDTPFSLWGRCLEFSKIARDSSFPAGSIVYFPWKGMPGRLTISVERSALTPQFIEDVFDRPKSEILDAHQLAQRGVALSLTPNRMNMTIYPSVVLRLRTDILGDNAYRTFIGQPTFKVEDVSGDAYVAADISRISSAFPEVFIQYVFPMKENSTRVLPDGRTQSTGTVPSQDALPPRQTPMRAPH